MDKEKICAGIVRCSANSSLALAQMMLLALDAIERERRRTPGFDYPRLAVARLMSYAWTAGREYGQVETAYEKDS
jgi:hypothetical protein